MVGVAIFGFANGKEWWVSPFFGLRKWINWPGEKINFLADYFQSVTGDCEEYREAFDIHCDQL